eukprot:TRINITY_DN28023_c0_g1_i1.p1 TRINITY_DN28023_c0_g1~~TRINITY_DN28023_c0_g1_i1.p1  ORF type:complete len:424 (-),score=42.70 TRINITY_DN28023_c0_g1_i1:24-1295(-)
MDSLSAVLCAVPSRLRFKLLAYAYCRRVAHRTGLPQDVLFNVASFLANSQLCYTLDLAQSPTRFSLGEVLARFKKQKGKPVKEPWVLQPVLPRVLTDMLRAPVTHVAGFYYDLQPCFLFATSTAVYCWSPTVETPSRIDLGQERNVLHLATRAYDTPFVLCEGGLYTISITRNLISLVLPRTLPRWETKIEQVGFGKEFILFVCDSTWLYVHSCPLVMFFEDEIEPIPLLRMPAAIDKISCGARHAVVLCGGTVWTLGRGECGQLGHGDCSDSPTPRMVAAFKGLTVNDVAAGYAHTVVGCDDGLYIFGAWRGSADLQPKVPVPSRVLMGHRVVQVVANHGECLPQRNLPYCLVTTADGTVHVFRDDPQQPVQTVSLHGRPPRQLALSHDFAVLMCDAFPGKACDLRTAAPHRNCSTDAGPSS